MNKLYKNIGQTILGFAIILSLVHAEEQQTNSTTAEPQPVRIQFPKGEYNPPLFRTRSLLQAAPSTLATTVNAAQTYTGNSWTYWAENNKMRLYFNINYSDNWKRFF